MIDFRVLNKLLVRQLIDPTLLIAKFFLSFFLHDIVTD